MDCHHFGGLLKNDTPYPLNSAVSVPLRSVTTNSTTSTAFYRRKRHGSLAFARFIPTAAHPKIPPKIGKQDVQKQGFLNSFFLGPPQVAINSMEPSSKLISFWRGPQRSLNNRSTIPPPNNGSAFKPVKHAPGPFSCGSCPVCHGPKTALHGVGLMSWAPKYCVCLCALLYACFSPRNSCRYTDPSMP